MRLALLALVACAAPAPVRTVMVRTVVEPMRCTLPGLPERARLVGYPAGAPSVLDLVLTRADGAELERELAGWRAWAAAVAACVDR